MGMEIKRQNPLSEPRHRQTPGGATLPDEERRRILKRRARALARKRQGDPTDRRHIEVLEFLVSTERYAIESSFVREVYPLRELTPLPCTPSFVLGIVNVRGQILSVIDIKKFFELPEKGLTNLSKMIILRTDKMEFGILADVILGVSQLLINDIQRGLPTLTGIREEYLIGITRERAIILDAEKLLTDKKIIVHEEVEI
jgi:purine-binding chemotaxis protein CheW